MCRVCRGLSTCQPASQCSVGLLCLFTAGTWKDNQQWVEIFPFNALGKGGGGLLRKLQGFLPAARGLCQPQGFFPAARVLARTLAMFSFFWLKPRPNSHVEVGHVPGTAGTSQRLPHASSSALTEEGATFAMISPRDYSSKLRTVRTAWTYRRT
jgi:hypothetical protein